MLFKATIQSQLTIKLLKLIWPVYAFCSSWHIFSLQQIYKPKFFVTFEAIGSWFQTEVDEHRLLLYAWHIGFAVIDCS